MSSVAKSLALITGGSNGLGAALAIQAASIYQIVLVADLDAEAGEALAKKKGNIHFSQVDLASPEARAQMVDLAKGLGPIDLLVNNAAVSVGGPLHTTPKQDVDWLLDINLRAAVQLSRAVLPDMVARASGHIANISSAAGLIGMPYRSVYCAAKSGLRGFSESLRAELQGTGVGVSIVHPGPVKTQMFERSRYSLRRLRDNESSYLTKAGMDPEKLASVILGGIARNQFVMTPGRQSCGLDLVRRFFPESAVYWLGRFRDRLPA